MGVKAEVEVVISGVGGYFPGSMNIQEFQKNLLNNESLVQEARWKKGQYDVCNTAGVLPEIRFFDSSFFYTHRKQARFMDPMHRMALEKTFEAIADAGVNINEVKGKRVGVFMASTISENDSLMFEAVENGFGVSGQARTMLANRISYWLNVTGPSCSMDASWTGGTHVIQMACEAIRTGQCEAAVVGGVNLHMNIAPTYAVKQLGVTCMDGITKPFDDDADGYVRSELIAVLFLQRASDAKRQYATIVHAGLLYQGNSDRHLCVAEPDGFANFLDNFYNTCGVNPKDVQYLETYGCGIKNLDEIELKMVEELFCKDRNGSLQIGSVKSNGGHAEASSDFMSLIKVLIAMETGIIPATLHYKNPNRNIPGLTNGSLEVVTQNKRWTPTLAGINSFGFGSSFGHILLRASSPMKKERSSELPLLKLLSSRSEEGIKEITDIVAKESVKDLEYAKLTNDVFSSAIQGHLFRGYVMDGTEIKHETAHFTGNQKQIWFVYSGMGSQWIQMGKDLMRLPIFANSVNKCHEILEPKGLDLRAIITENNPGIFENILHSFVGIAAIQIGLTDVLSAVGIVPDGIIGHSVGELGCAYADGCLTTEQMILSAYYRGKASQDVELVTGIMAAVGMGYKQIKNLCPPNIDVACHNGADSSTLSGPRDEMMKFVATLQKDGVFARLVNVSNIAYHSRYIKPAAPLLLKYLQKIIPEPKTRSSKWISTSVQEINWASELARCCSAEYLTNNLLSSVYFEEGSKYIPRDSTVIEIAPHGLLQAILKRSLAADVMNIPLTQRGNKKSLEFLFSALGKLYLTGIDLNLDQLYPAVRFPVGRGTRSLAPLVSWLHLDDWPTGVENFKYYITSENTYTINLNIEGFQDIIGFRIGRKYVVPPAALLMLVYEIMSNLKCNILFENVSIKRHILQSATDSQQIVVTLHRGTGNFEITEGDEIVMRGRITLPDSFQKEYTKIFPMEMDGEYMEMDEEDIYNEFQERGYNFREDFRSVKQVRLHEKGTLATIEWKNNWSAFLSGMIQLHMLKTGEKTQNILLPSFIRRILINFNEIPEDGSDIEIHYDHFLGQISSLFAQISDIVYKPYTEEDYQLIVDNYRFVRYQNENILNLQMGVDIILQILLQNINSMSNMNIFHLTESAMNMEKYITDFCRRYPLSNIKYTTLKSSEEKLSIPSATMVIIGDDNLFNLKNLLTEISDFVLLCLSSPNEINFSDSLTLVAKFTLDKYYYYLLRKITKERSGEILNISSKEVHSRNLEYKTVCWVKELSSALSVKKNGLIYLVFRQMPLDGIEDFVNNLKLKDPRQQLRFIFILDKNAPEFALNEPFYEQMWRQNLQVVVFQDGAWGSWLYKTISFPLNKKHNQISESCLSKLKTRVDVKYLGVNLDSWVCDSSRDENKLGPLEYAGFDVCGNRVMGIARPDLDLFEITPDPILSWPIPDSWSFADAATVPYSYGMAYYVLVELIDIRPDATMLVHNACSSFGRAICQIGLHFGYNIYVTVGSESQKAYLLETMRPIEEEQILDYNDTAFEAKLLLATHNKGADLIINSLPGDRMHASLRCVSDTGYIVQVNVSEEDENETIGLSLFAKCLGMYGLAPRDILDFPDEVKRKIHALVLDGLQKEIVWYHQKKIFPGNNIDAALRYLNSKTVIGSALVSAEVSVDVEFANVANYMQYKCDRNSCYLIYGCDPIILSALTQWLAIHGCRKLIIIAEKPDRSYLRRRLLLINNYYNTKIKLVMDNSKVNTKSVAFLQDVNRMGSISTVFVFPKRDGTDYLEYMKELDENLAEVANEALLVCMGGDNKNMLYKRTSSAPGSNIRWFSTQPFANIGDYFGKVLIEGADIILRDEKSVEITKSYKDFNLLLPLTQKSLLNISSDLSKDIELFLVPSKSRQKPVDVPPLFIIPDLFGANTEHVRAFARKLMYPTYVIELNNSSADFHSCKSRITQIIKQTYSRGPFNIIGISWGGALAIEVAKELETIGEQVELFLVDGIPDTIQSIIQEECSEEKLEINLLKYLLQLQHQEDINTLTSIESWTARVDKAVSLFNYSKKQHEKMVNVLHLIKCRMDSIMSYKTSEKQINGYTHLFIPVDSKNTNSQSLTKYCKQVKAEILLGNHFTILQGQALPDYINDNTLIKM